MEAPKFRMGRLDHVHLRVPDIEAAVEWYAEHLGFEPVTRFSFWADAVEGGPHHLSADGGATAIALFQASESHPMRPQQAAVAFSVDATTFIAFVEALPNTILGVDGEILHPDDVIDFDMCWAIDLADPWGNVFELNTYDYDDVRRALVEPGVVTPQRYWPQDLYATYRA